MSLILHVGEAFCDENPEIGPTNSNHNLYNTFSQCRPEKSVIINSDSADILYKTHIDNILIDFVKNYNVKIIFISLVNGSSRNPSFETFKKLKDLNCYLAFHFPDFGPGFGTQTAIQLGDLADLLICWDNGKGSFNNDLPKVLKLWVPQDLTFYYMDKQTIPASFVGSTKGYWDRQILIQNLKQYFPQIQFRGGQREESLNPYEYAKIIRQSKIGINFSNSLAQFSQVKGRVYEILASGSMLFEMNNPATASILKPDYDYVSFSNPKEMIEKLQYYLTHDDERKKIAEQGYQTYNKYYTAQIFWDTIFTRIYKDLNERT